MNIAIWGAGKFGSLLLKKLADHDIEVKCFIDNYCKISEIEGIKVVRPESFLEEDYGVEFVLVAIINIEGLIEQLDEMGVERYGVVVPRVMIEDLKLDKNIFNDSNIIWNTDKELRLPQLETLEINLVDFCNMNCKGCSHFSNIFPVNSKTKYEIFERDIKQLSQKVYIRQFNLLGGEVFLCDNLSDYILCIREYMPKTHIELVSNGMLIPKQDDKTLKVIEENNVTISITEYPPVTKVKSKIIEKLDKYNIAYRFRALVETFGKNIDLSGNNDPILASKSCREYKCQFLRDGKLYKCPFSALGNYYFEHYDISLRFDEGYDIFDESLDWQYLADNIRTQPIKACQYCGREQQFKWEVSHTPSPDDWLI